MMVKLKQGQKLPVSSGSPAGHGPLESTCFSPTFLHWE